MGAARAPIVVVLADAAERDAVRSGLDRLRELECGFDVALVPAAADPRLAMDLARQAEEEGRCVVLAGGERLGWLPDVLAAACRLPVVAIGPPGAAPAGSQAAWVREPVPAALMAARIAAVADPALARRLGEDAAAGPRPSAPPLEPAAPASPRAEPWDEDASAEDEDEAWKRGWRTARPHPEEPAEEGEERVEIRPVDWNRPLKGSVVGGAHRPSREEEAPPAPPPPRRLGRIAIEPESPELDVIEEVVDCLLEGGVVALPTDTVYGLAVDATNPAAVERLFELKGRGREKPIVLMVDSPKLLGQVARNLTVAVRRLMEAFWPGPLTLILQKREGNFTHISPGPTIGVRLPDHSTPLTIIQALARPIACTSANPSGAAEARSADEVEDYFGDELSAILDAGPLAESLPSTVLDVTAEPFQIRRLGALGREQLAAVVGDVLEGD